MPETPPIGKSIRDEDRPNSGGPDSESTERDAQHVVVTPQTAGSAGAAHPSEPSQES